MEPKFSSKAQMEPIIARGTDGKQTLRMSQKTNTKNSSTPTHAHHTHAKTNSSSLTHEIPSLRYESSLWSSLRVMCSPPKQYQIEMAPNKFAAPFGFAKNWPVPKNLSMLNKPVPNKYVFQHVLPKNNNCGHWNANQDNTLHW